MVQQKEKINGETTVLYHKEEEGIWIDGLDSRAAEVTIPGQIAGMPVTGIYKKAFFNSRFLVSLRLPDSLTQIGDWAFAHCPRLVRVCLPYKRMELGKSLFLGSDLIEEIQLILPEDGQRTAGETEGTVGRSDRPAAVAGWSAGMTGEAEVPWQKEQSRWAEALRQDVPALLASAVRYLDADYLFSTWEAGSEEWIRKWDSRLLEIICRSDQEGFTKQVLCGEEDYGNTDLGRYETQRREEKVRLCFTRLLHPWGMAEKTKETLTEYLLDHTAGCATRETWEVVRREYAHKRQYYEFFARIGCVTGENFDEILADLGERQPELKAYLMRYKEETLGHADFFDSLSLDF